jgi:hypothetical protein
MFPVSSEIVTGQAEAVLIDAQFQRNDAEALVQKIKATGKKLTTVYISHSDPDYYFGLDVVQAAFPDAKIVATPQTVAAIQASKDGKLAHWGPVLKDNAPKALVVPEALAGDSITLEGRKIQVVGLDGPTPERSFAWIPSLKAVVGGIPVSANIHVWMGRHANAAIPPRLAPHAGPHRRAAPEDGGARPLPAERERLRAVHGGIGEVHAQLPAGLRSRGRKSKGLRRTRRRDEEALPGAERRLVARTGRQGHQGRMKWPQ